MHTDIDSSVSSPENGSSPYKSLGVRPFINCCGARTIHGGGLMAPNVLRAMGAASKESVNIDELMAAVGQRIAGLTGADSAIVTCGAAASLCLGTAACLTRGDPEKILRLPNTEGINSAVAMLEGSRFSYDHAIRMPGAKIQTYRDAADFANAIAARPALVAVLASSLSVLPISLVDICSLGRRYAVPVLVDAASEAPSSPDAYLGQGASLVAYSGGKLLRGPQPSGLLIGDKALVRAAWLNAAPHHAFGRAMKVGKEEVIGCLAALEAWFSEAKHETEIEKCRHYLRIMADALARVPYARIRLIDPEGQANRLPLMEVSWNLESVDLSGLELRDQLLAGEPRIMLDDRCATENSILINAFNLRPGEAELVGERIGAVLASTQPRRSNATPHHKTIAGRWQLRIQFAAAEATHEVEFAQTGQELNGIHRTPFSEAIIRGRIEGERISFACDHKHEGTSLVFQFCGSVKDRTLVGELTLGTEGQAAIGPLNRSEFGTVPWSAVMVNH